jgi:hypothetical protein
MGGQGSILARKRLGAAVEAVQKSLFQFAICEKLRHQSELPFSLIDVDSSDSRFRNWGEPIFVGARNDRKLPHLCIWHRRRYGDLSLGLSVIPTT